MDLVQAAHCLRQATTLLGTEFHCGDSLCRVSGTVSETDGSYVTVWLFGVGFGLRSEGFLQFVTLVEQAIARYQTVGDDPIQSLIDADYPEHPQIFLSLN